MSNKSKFLFNHKAVTDFVSRLRPYILQDNDLIDRLLKDDYMARSDRTFLMLYYSCSYLFYYSF